MAIATTTASPPATLAIPFHQNHGQGCLKRAVAATPPQRQPSPEAQVLPSHKRRRCLSPRAVYRPRPQGLDNSGLSLRPTDTIRGNLAPTESRCTLAAGESAADERLARGTAVSQAPFPLADAQAVGGPIVEVHTAPTQTWAPSRGALQASVKRASTQGNQATQRPKRRRLQPSCTEKGAIAVPLFSIRAPGLATTSSSHSPGGRPHLQMIPKAKIKHKKIASGGSPAKHGRTSTGRHCL